MQPESERRWWIKGFTAAAIAIVALAMLLKALLTGW